MSRYLRKRFPRAYKAYQETIGDLYYELLGGGPLTRLISWRRLRHREADLSDPLATAMNFRGIGLYRTIRPFQVHSEIAALFQTVRDLKPRVIGEIGSDMGGTLFLWSRILPPDGMILSVDLPRLYRKSLNRFFTGFFEPSQTVAFVREDSHSPGCIARVRALLAGRPFDFLFIDGDHSYEGVKKDFFLFQPLVRPGGIIAFHDIAKHNLPEDVCGVDKFWAEIKGAYPHREIIADINQNGAGIGILYNSPLKTADQPPAREG